MEPRLPEHNVFLKSVSRGPTGRFGRRVWCRKGDTLIAITELYRARWFYTARPRGVPASAIAVLKWLVSQFGVPCKILYKI